MNTPINSELRALKRGKPGRRFQDRYEQGKRKRAGASVTARVVRLVLAIVAIAIGVVLIFIPGPAVLFFFIAGGLLASESRLIAQLLDRAEVLLRAGFKWSVRRWRALSLVGKIAVTLVAATLAGAAAFAAWQVMFD